MLKDKISWKLVNIALALFIFVLLYQTGHLWIDIFKKLWTVALPFLIAFTIAYALHPFVNKLRNKKIPKGFAILIVVLIAFALMATTIGLMFPLLFGQLNTLFNNILAFIKELSLNYDLDLGVLQTSLSDVFNDVISSFSKYISDGAVSIIGVSLSVLGNTFIVIAAAVYFLIDMDKIRPAFKHLLIRKNKRTFRYVEALDNEMKAYITGFIKIVFITFIEYTVAYTIIGHPSALLLGFVAAMGNLIPYFGGIATNMIAAITAFAISPSLFIKTCIAFFVCSNLDGYVINPYVYGKSNKVHPLVTILAVFAGGILFGILGIIISLPVTIIIITTIKYYSEDLADLWEEVRGGKGKD